RYHYSSPTRRSPDLDGDRREHHGAPGGVDRHLDRLVAIAPAANLRAEARDDEQRVVDPDAETDQRRELRGEVRRVDQVADERDRSEEHTSELQSLAY